EAVAAEWMLEFACSCLCRHFAEQSGPEFWRWRDVAQALINGLSQIPPHQKKTVYLCQLLIRIAQGKSLGLRFENDQRISPLESALSFWTLLEREEIKLAKLHEDIHLLIQIQIVAVYMENRYFKEAAEVLERLFTDSESDKPLRVKLATVIKNKDPYVPLLQSFSYSNLISKVKSYTELFMKENESNFLIQGATKHVASKGLGAVTLQIRPLEVNENDKSDLKTKKRFVLSIILLRDVLGQKLTTSTFLFFFNLCVLCRRSSGEKSGKNRVLQSLSNMHNVGRNEVSLICSRRRQRWTHEEDLELKLGVKDFGVGNWSKILAHGNFNNRTSVMLKDRWRTLSKMK
ncbi:TERF1 factor, partial [Catharus fuscescens]|nr:TERF1 factor [Catharus fuscescens]